MHKMYLLCNEELFQNDSIKQKNINHLKVLMNKQKTYISINECIKNYLFQTYFICLLFYHSRRPKIVTNSHKFVVMCIKEKDHTLLFKS